MNTRETIRSIESDKWQNLYKLIKSKTSHDFKTSLTWRYIIDDVDHITDTTFILRACMDGKVNLVRSLIDLCPNLNIANKEGFTPFIFSGILQPNVQIMKLLVKNTTHSAPVIESSELIFNEETEDPITFLVKAADNIKNKFINACKETNNDRRLEEFLKEEAVLVLKKIPPEVLIKFLTSKMLMDILPPGILINILPLEILNEITNNHSYSARPTSNSDNCVKVELLPEELSLALLQAIHDHQINKFKELLEHKSLDINATNKFGTTALNLTIKENREDMFKLLLKHEALNVNVNAGIATEGDIALHLAVFLEKTDMVTILLNHESLNINAANIHGTTALHLAAKENKKEMLKLLLAKESLDVNAATNQGVTALHSAVYEDKIEAVELLLEHKLLDINSSCKQGGTAVFQAAALNRVKILEKLLAKKPDLAIPDQFGVTPLIIAVIKNHQDIVHMLLNHANINCSDKRGHSPLFHAMAVKSYVMVRLLLGRGASIENIYNGDEYPQYKGISALKYAEFLKDIDLETIIKHHIDNEKIKSRNAKRNKNKSKTYTGQTLFTDRNNPQVNQPTMATR